MNTYCGDCRYFGAESGKKYGEVPQHICECKESIFKSCARTASGCDKYEKMKGDRNDKTF